MSKCLICEKELRPDMAQIIITKGVHKYEGVCCSHEWSKELTDLINE